MKTDLSPFILFVAKRCSVYKSKFIVESFFEMEIYCCKSNFWSFIQLNFRRKFLLEQKISITHFELYVFFCGIDWDKKHIDFILLHTNVIKWNSRYPIRHLICLTESYFLYYIVACVFLIGEIVTNCITFQKFECLIWFGLSKVFGEVFDSLEKL